MCHIPISHILVVFPCVLTTTTPRPFFLSLVHFGPQYNLQSATTLNELGQTDKRTKKFVLNRTKQVRCDHSLHVMLC